MLITDEYRTQIAGDQLTSAHVDTRPALTLTLVQKGGFE